MKIAVLIYGRLNTCVEHYSNYIDSLGKEVDFFYLPIIHLKIYFKNLYIYINQ